MKNIIESTIFQMMDPASAPELKTLKDGDSIDNKKITLSSRREVFIHDLIKSGPLILIFIRGTWCPFCRMHMQRLNKWLNSRPQNKRGTCIVVSSESIEDINKWLSENNFSYLFASDQEMKLADYFGVHIAPRDFSQAATFLIDQEAKVRMTYKGKRTNKNFKKLDENLRS